MMAAIHGASATATIVGITVGGAALMIGFGWRQHRLRESAKSLEECLRNPNPVMRAETARAAAALGLERSGGLLLRAARTEQDPMVLQAIEAAIGSRLWEPVTTPEVAELRRWAAHYAAASKGAPTAPRGDEAATTVVVTGAGGPAGVAVIRELRRRGHHVIAVDADPSAVGFELASEGHVVPTWDDPAFSEELIAVASEAGARALISTIAEEFRAIDAAALEAAGVRTMLPDAEAVHRCLDKWAFVQAMDEAGVATPATGLGTPDGVPGPWIVKPRFGRGSRDVYAPRNPNQLKAALLWTPDPIVQTLVSGREFTVDVLVDGSGTVAGMVPRWRLETKAGISTKGLTFSDPDVEIAAMHALKAVGLIGPANVQGFVTDDGRVVVVEINPRFSGGLPLSLHAGADLVGEYLRAILGERVRPERLVAQPGVVMRRYFEEVFSA
jgi:carbamoylphosphate synthase large subunit